MAVSQLLRFDRDFRCLHLHLDQVSPSSQQVMQFVAFFDAEHYSTVRASRYMPMPSQKPAFFLETARTGGMFMSKPFLVFFSQLIGVFAFDSYEALKLSLPGCTEGSLIAKLGTSQ